METSRISNCGLNGSCFSCSKEAQNVTLMPARCLIYLSSRAWVFVSVMHAHRTRGRRALLRTCFGIKPSELCSVSPEQSGTFCGNSLFPFEPTRLVCLCCLSSNVVCRSRIFAVETLIGATSSNNYWSCSSASNCFSCLRVAVCTCRGHDETAAKFVSFSFHQNKLGNVGKLGFD